MKVLIVGLGVQGLKRKKLLIKTNNYVASVDPLSINSEYKNINDVPLDFYDSCFLCVPDKVKKNLINFCLKNKKHVLVEKPLICKNKKEILDIEKKAKKDNLIIYTAYNHRFEPNLVKMKNLISSKKLGKIYSCKMFYGNGTAKLVKKSNWRDNGNGVLGDLGPHLLDLCNYFFESKLDNLNLIKSLNHENKSPDHVTIDSMYKKTYISLEMTLCMWKNYFTCDVIGEKGSAHVESFCKWGSSKFIYRERKLPSGKPKESINILNKADPTWKLEHDYFKKLIKDNKKTNLQKDLWIFNSLSKLITTN